VDFKVRETKSYSIFIEEELCEIAIERQADRFVYGFDINKDVDTPLNRERKATDKKHLKQGFAFLAGLTVLITFILIGSSYMKKEYTPSMASLLAASGKESSAKVFFPNPKEATYDFVANGKIYSDKAPFKLDINTVLENGMPMEDGDEFLVKYSSSQPEVNKIHFNRPTEKQIDIYQQRAVLKYQKNHPTESEAYCNCLTAVAYELEGVNGYAKFYLQDLTHSQNKRYNSDSFHRLIRSVEFQKRAEEKCWEKR